MESTLETKGDLAFVLFFAGCVLAAWVLGLVTAHAQAAAPIFTFPAATQPNCSASFDVPNKLLVTTCSIGGVALPAISYNPRVLEGNNGGGFTIAFAGISILYQHNLATDGLKYQLGTSTTIILACSAVTGAPAGSPVCPAMPF
jgi:hypothetical protein